MHPNEAHHKQLRGRCTERTRSISDHDMTSNKTKSCNATRGLPLHAALTTPAPADRLANLPFDLPQYVAVEKRLRSARWLTAGGPGVGAQAELVAEIPYTVSLVGILIGAPEVVATITEWSPPQRIAFTFDGRRFEGWAAVELDPVAGGSHVRIKGMVTAKAALAQIALRAIQPQLERLATSALERGVRRAAAHITSARPDW